MAKGQGLPLSFIVIAAISALVLILIVAFTIGGLGGFFKQINIAGGSDELSTVQTACQNACNKAQFLTTESQFNNSDYCSKTYAIDLNKDGKINATTETKIHCWYTPGTVKGTVIYASGPGVDCTVQIGANTYTGASTPGCPK